MEWLNCDHFFLLGGYKVEDLRNKGSRFYGELSTLTYLIFVQDGSVPSYINQESKTSYKELMKPCASVVATTMKVAERYISWLVLQPTMQHESIKKMTVCKSKRYHKMVRQYISLFEEDESWVQNLPEYLPVV